MTLNLFSPIQLGPYELPNRIVTAPLTRSRAGNGNVPHTLNPLEQIEGWKQITTAVHVAGGRIFLKLWHIGRISHQSFQPNGALPVAPSAIRPKGQAYTTNGFEDYPTPRALETAEIPGVVEGYRQARSAAKPLAPVVTRST